MSTNIRRNVLSAFAFVTLAFITITVNTLALTAASGAVTAPDATSPRIQVATTAATAVSHWRFDDGSGTTATDTILPALNGTLNGGATWSTDVARVFIANPYAIALDGTTGFVEIPDDDAIDFDTNQDFTVAFWTKPAATQNPTGSNTDNAILEKWSDGTDGYPYVVRYLNQLAGADEGKVFVARYDGTVGTGMTSSVAINDGKYHHVAMVRDGGSSGTLSLYIDGVLQDSIPDVVSSTTNNNSPLFVGKRGNNINYYSGLVDDLRIYSGALTSSEVAYLGTGCPDITTTVSDWAELSNKIGCFNRLTRPGTYTLTLTANIDLFVSALTIDNSTPDVELTIEGNGHTVNGDDISGVRPFQVAADTVVTLNHITISGGNVAGDGGGILNAGFLTVQKSTVTGNQASTGGGIWNSGTLVVMDSTISANGASNGGGIWNFNPSSEITLTNSTISGNVVGNAAGGIGNQGLMTVTNSTVADNSSLLGGGILNGELLTLNNSIIANNTGFGGEKSDCEPDRGRGTVTAAFSLIEANLCDLGDGIGNITGQDPNLGSLQNNGGPTLIHALLIPSPAIEAGSNALAVDGNGVTLTTDQRGVGYRRLAGTTVDMGAFEQPCAFPDSVGDEAVLNDVIACFNAITVPGSYTITLTADIGLTGDTTTIDNATTGVALLIDGNGKTLDGNDAYRPLDIAANTTATVQNLTITRGRGFNNGSAFDGGGAIRNAGSLTITNSTLSNNNGDGSVSVGGGVFNNGGTVTIMNSTLNGNTTTRFGGGVFNTGALAITNSTLSGNLAGEGGGVYNNGGTVTITNSTLSGNDGFNAVGNDGGAVTINNSIITASPGFDCANSGGGSFSGGSNLVDDPTGPCAGATFRLGAVTNFDTTLGDNGGPTLTHALLAGSNAIDAGDDALAVDESNAPLTTDQRGFSRFVGPVDVGAVESELGCPVFPANVESENILNRAIECFNGITAPGSYTINLSADIDLTGSMTRIDNGTSGVALLIEGNGFKLDGKNIATVRPLDIAVNTTVAIQNLTVTGGNVSGSGGGVQNAGNLTITNSTLSGNRATTGGGAVRNAGGGTLTIVNSTLGSNMARFGGSVTNAGTLTITSSTLSGNSASDSGGGVFIGGGGDLTLANSTLSGNSASRDGGGVYIGGGGDLTITNSTLSGNGASGEGGGVYEASGTVTLNNAIITNSTSGGDCTTFDGIEFSGSYNLVDDLTGPCAGATFRLGGVTNFDATLGDNGGPTLTHALLAGSNAINATPLSVTRLDGTQSVNVVCGGLVPDTDQRGINRPQGGACDIGAYEAWWMTISAVSTTDASLAWSSANTSCTYDIFESTTPYFTPTGLATYTTVSLTQALAGKLGTVSTNYFYINRAACGGSTTAYSNEVGEFDFALVPGN